MSDIYSRNFDWSLFAIISVFALPGFLLGIGGFIRTYWPYIRVHYPDYKKHNVIGGYILVSFIFIFGAVAIGIALSPTTNARFIYFMSIIKQKNEMQAFLFELIPALFIGIPASLAYLFYYFYQIRPMFENESLIKFEKIRNHAGLGVRIFYFGVAGEIFFRWGIQTVFIWFFLGIFSNPVASNIISIFLVSLVAGWVHMAGLGVIDKGFDKKLKMKMFLLHFLQSIVFGIIFWKFGILSAMIAHSLHHVIWYPLDIFYYRKLPADS